MTFTPTPTPHLYPYTTVNLSVPIFNCPYIIINHTKQVMFRVGHLRDSDSPEKTYLHDGNLKSILN